MCFNILQFTECQTLKIITIMVQIIIILIVICVILHFVDFEKILALAFIGGMIYLVKSLFDFTWMQMVLGFIIFCLGCHIWEKIK